MFIEKGQRERGTDDEKYLISGGVGLLGAIIGNSVGLVLIIYSVSHVDVFVV